jgi:hypothetical protein
MARTQRESVVIPDWARSAAAIVAGIVTIGVLALGADELTRRLAPEAFDAKGFTDNPAVLLAIALYTTAISALGGFLTALLSPATSVKRDVWILAVLQTAATALAMALQFDRRLAWFYAATLILTPLAIAAGGWLRARVRKSSLLR